MELVLPGGAVLEFGKTDALHVTQPYLVIMICPDIVDNLMGWQLS